MKKFLREFIINREQPLVKLAFQSFFLRLAGLGLIFLSQIILARLMGPKDFGNYTVIMTWLNIIVVFCLFGFDQSALRFLSLYHTQGEVGKMRGFIRFSFRFILIVAFVCMMVLFWLLLTKARRYSLTYSESLFWSLFLIPVLVIINQCSALLRAIQKVRLSLTFIYIIIPSSLIVAILLYYYYYGMLRYDGAIFLYLACTFFIAWIISSRVRNQLGPAYSLSEPVYRSRSWVSVSLVFLAMNLLALLVKQLDILMLSHFDGNTKAGIYSAAVRFSSFITFGLMIVDFVFTPRISSIHAKNDLSEFQNFVTQSAKVILLITVPIAIFLAVAGKYLLLIYGKQFAVSYVPLLILIGGQVITALAGMTGPLLTMTGNQNLFILIYFLAVVLDFLLNLLLIPLWGAIGAATATALSSIALSVTMYVVVRKKLNIRASI